jgi:glycosyltransferase involved in cell wall biosynthesis
MGLSELPFEPVERVPRVAFFTDSFHETNGVALTSRQFAAFAKSTFRPFFSVHAGPRAAHWKRGTFETFELDGSNCRLNLEHDLSFDLLFARHYRALRTALASFAPDLIHVTGPGHMGMLGAFLAHDLKVPLVASWHTNVHEFGARRLAKALPWLPKNVVNGTESGLLTLAVRFYKLARLLFAPNPELSGMLAARTGKPVHLMQRGIDTGFYAPEKRPHGERPFTIGYVGRLSAEKSVRLFAALDRTLRSAGVQDHQFLIAGEGSERAWLREHLPAAILPGLLHGEDLAQAYASMDVFVFPSETDTFGNVILEAAASGVPSVVSPHGGPKFLVDAGRTGFIAAGAHEFASAVAGLHRDPDLRRRMSVAARSAALDRSWSAVFQKVYSGYRQVFPAGLPAIPPRQKTFRTIPVS